MNMFFDSVRKHPRLWLWVAILSTVFTSLMMRRSGRCLKTSTAPYAIVSLELAWSQQEANKIRDEWDTHFCNNGNTVTNASVILPNAFIVTDMAQKNIIDDITFLIAYTLFFMVCVVRLDASRLPGEPVSQRTKTFVAFALMAGALDSIENFFMWKFLETGDVASYAFAFPATIKFILVLLLSIYILFSFIKEALFPH
jgi:hypothetical protein